ncbi:MAG: hypothetical protein ACYC6Y_10085 [Thermoguttaceae bacterium]
MPLSICSRRVPALLAAASALVLAICPLPDKLLGQAPASRAASAPPAAAGSDSPPPDPGTCLPQILDFNTPELEGTIRLDGAYHGITRLVHKPSGRQVIDPRYSALNLFKLMSVNLVMGQPRQMERSVQFGPDWAEIRWGRTDSHLGKVVARYEVRPPNAVDLAVTIRCEGTYPVYEVFLSSYFDKILQPYVYLKTRDGKSSDLVRPAVSDVFRGTVLVFPRDMPSARHCLDGRWERREGGVPVVQMCPVRPYAHCLGMLVEPDKTLAVVLMASPGDCYAFSTRYYAPDEADRLTTYSAFDFSLFGSDFVPGSERTARIRLAVTPLDPDFSTPLKLYQEFLAEMEKGALP